jgi:uncharacterized SAM-binding protein YcdF (DUF218 family)
LKKITVCLAAVAFLMVTLFAAFAPGFLFLDNIPRKADAVILFVGPGNTARLDEARQLIKDGYARFLFIPNSGELFTADPAGELVRLASNQPRGDLFRKIRIAANYKKHYEKTHVEALEAKRMLDDLGLRSAMLVSSAYHMRRIRLIAGRVFDAREYSISCNPARWQASFTPGDWLDRERRKIMVSEYVKIAWFLVYGMAGS